LLNKIKKKIWFVQVGVLFIAITLILSFAFNKNSIFIIKTFNQNQLVNFALPCTESTCSITCNPDTSATIECLSSSDCDDDNPCTKDICISANTEYEVDPYRIEGACHAVTILPQEGQTDYACTQKGSSCVFNDGSATKPCIKTGIEEDGEKKPFCICPAGYEVESNNCEYIDDAKIGTFSCVFNDGCSSFLFESYTFKDTCNKGNIATGACVCKKINAEHCYGTRCEHIPATSYTSCITDKGLSGYCLYNRCVRTEVISLPIKWSFMIKGRAVFE